MAKARRLILASGSAARRNMLENAGVPFDAEPAKIDESALKDALIRHPTSAPAHDIAVALADAKALDVSKRNPDALGVGSDQVLALGEQLLSKASGRDSARLALLALRGKTHALHSAVSLARNGAVVWRYNESARLTMRSFSDAWLDRYLDHAGDALVHCVGGYRLEGLGIQLFEKIEGDYFTILGMPLLALLGELRQREMIAT